ncbi:hypothetical protein B0T10DRAFT_596916 [Thelonectria olida]|uniref:Uncharacterized protein n=1 Tax=Thelonectria olida TaxID=1576542 RepID=A0A9P9AGJ2_9HYPO|nr:hypothetical protein B0T10DRAFT_596916 [Thelonectria olida]
MEIYMRWNAVALLTALSLCLGACIHLVQCGSVGPPITLHHLGSPRTLYQHVRSLGNQSQAQATCPDLQLPPTNGGRRIGLLWDNTRQMNFLDPRNLRARAISLINGSAIDDTESSSSRQADRITVVAGGADAEIWTPLGDPTTVTLDGIEETMNLGGNDSHGVAWWNITIDEILKGRPTRGTASLVAIKGSNDDLQDEITIGQLNRTLESGIRVFNCLLANDLPTLHGPAFQSMLMIQRGGGIFCHAGDAAALNSFASAVLAHGITGTDNSTSFPFPVLIPGLSFAIPVPAAGSVRANYSIIAGERVDPWITCLGNCSANYTLRNLSDGAVLEDGDASSSDSSRHTSTSWRRQGGMGYSDTDGIIRLEATSLNSTHDQWIMMGINSSYGPAHCTIREPKTTLSSGSATGEFSPGLTTGEKVGIGLGVTVGILSLLAVFFFIWRKSNGLRFSHTDRRYEFPNENVRAEENSMSRGMAELPGTSAPAELVATVRYELEGPGNIRR